MANRANLPQRLVLDAARETVSLFYEVWPQERTNLPLSTDLINAVEHQLRTIPLAGVART